jgi:hypothetical protein
MAEKLYPKYQPANTYPKKSRERRIFGQIVSWFYHSHGQFPIDEADKDGYVFLDRLLSTKKFRSLGANPQITNVREYVIGLLKDAFDILETPAGIKIRGRIWHTHWLLELNE